MPEEPEPAPALRVPTAKDLEPEEVSDRVFRLPLALPFEVGPVNCYLFRRDEPVLVDTGPRTDESARALEEQLTRLSVAVADLRHIVVTHAHIDHHGNLARLAAASGAAIHAHEDDARGIFEHDENMLGKVPLVEALVRFWGYPERILGAVVKGYLSWRRFAESLPRDRYRPIAGPGAELALGETRLRAIHCPGHTEGLICLHVDEGEGLLLSNDHVLQQITPNPTAYLPPYRGRRTGLGDYLASLGRVRDLRAARVLPGHGPVFAGLARRVDEILRHHEVRKRRIGALIARGPKTTLEIVLSLWKSLAPDDYYLACREVHGHLDLLVEDGAARESLRADGAAAFEGTA